MEEPVKPFRVQMRVKNNRLIEAREEMGFTTVSSMARTMGMDKGRIGDYENFRRSPVAIARSLVTQCISEGCDVGVAPMHLVCRFHRPKKEELISKRELPKTWRADALTIASFLGVEQEWLWPECSREVSKAKTISVKMDMAQVEQFSRMPDSVDKAQLRERVEEVMQFLTPREKEVVTKRYGLNDGEEMSYREIAQGIGITHERVRQLESRALRRLKHPAWSKHLKEFDE